MIQRIQSIFMSFAAIAMIVFIFLPIARYTSGLYLFEQFAYYLHDLTKDEITIFSKMFTLPVLIIAILSALLSIATIFKYQNRLHQLKMLKINIILNIVLMISIFFVYPYIINETTGGYNNFELGAYFPLLSFTFLILAYRFVLKDEILVKSLDRLR
jgi:sterol desaturase/sphingolipid hydroxylase (fatty acid hydroxylase superfamily)